MAICGHRTKQRKSGGGEGSKMPDLGLAGAGLKSRTSPHFPPPWQAHKCPHLLYSAIRWRGVHHTEENEHGKAGARCGKCEE